MLDLQATFEAGELAGGERVLSALGPLDERVAGDLRATLIPLTDARGAPLFLDLTGAHGLDASAMLVIADAARLVERRGARLGIVTRSPAVLGLITESGLDGVVDVSATLGEAIGR